jgi:hypothetical protein
VVASRQPPPGGLDDGGGGTDLDTEHLVRIALDHVCECSDSRHTGDRP